MTHQSDLWIFNGAIVAMILLGLMVAAVKSRGSNVSIDREEVDSGSLGRPAKSPFTGGRSLAELGPGTFRAGRGHGITELCKICAGTIAETPLFRTSVDKFNRELPELEAALESGDLLADWAQRHHDREADPRGSVIGILDVCTRCKSSVLHIVPVKKGWLFERVRKDVNEEAISLSPPVTRNILSRLDDLRNP